MAVHASANRGAHYCKRFWHAFPAFTIQVPLRDAGEFVPWVTHATQPGAPVLAHRERLWLHSVCFQLVSPCAVGKVRYDAFPPDGQWQRQRFSGHPRSLL
eukprot:2994636-Pleurochrysis_carterae.AAC.1